MFIHKANLHLPLSFEALEEVVVRRFIHIICKDSEIKKSSVYYTIRNLSEQSEKSKNKEIKKHLLLPLPLPFLFETEIARENIPKYSISPKLVAESRKVVPKRSLYL